MKPDKHKRDSSKHQLSQTVARGFASGLERRCDSSPPPLGGTTLSQLSQTGATVLTRKCRKCWEAAA